MVADGLTLARLLLVILIIDAGLGAAGDRSALQPVILFNLLAWTTDILDGRFARASHTPASFVGRLDFPADMLLLWGTALALFSAYELPLWPLALYCLLAILLAARYHAKTVFMALGAPLATLPPWVAFQVGHGWGALYSLWILLALALNLERFGQVVSGFVNQLPRGFRRLVRRWLPAALVGPPDEDD